MEVDPATEYLMTELFRNRERSHLEDFPRYLQRHIRKDLCHLLSKFKGTDVVNILTMFIVCSLLMLFIFLMNITVYSWLYCNHFNLKVYNPEYYFVLCVHCTSVRQGPYKYLLVPPYTDVILYPLSYPNTIIHIILSTA